jgi:hypothetical protein
MKEDTRVGPKGKMHVKRGGYGGGGIRGVWSKGKGVYKKRNWISMGRN